MDDPILVTIRYGAHLDFVFHGYTGCLKKATVQIQISALIQTTYCIQF